MMSWIKRGALALVLGFAGGLAVSAQGAPQATPSPSASPTSAEAEPSARTEVQRMTPRQMVDRSEGYIGEMRTTLKDVLKILENARTEKDVVKLNCVNEKLTQVKGLVRVSEQSSISLQEAVAKQEIGDARHEYTKIAIAREKVQQLRAEAEECIGQLAFVIDQDMVVDVEVPEDLPEDDPVVPDVPPVVVRPPPASPTG